MGATRIRIGNVVSAWTAAFAIWLAAGPAAASDIGFIVSGTAPAHARKVASSAIASRTADLVGNELVPSTFSTREAATLTRCLSDGQPWACMYPTLRGKGVEQLAMLSIDSQVGADGSPIIVITEQIMAADLFAPIGDKRYCDHCTDDVLGKLVGELTRDLLREIATRTGRTVVAIKTVPRGARIKFDDKLMGATEQSLNTYPGPHSLSLELDGYQVAERSVEATDGKTVEVNVALVRNSGPGGTHDDPAVSAVTPPDGIAGWPRFVPWLCIGTGGAAIITGGILIAVDSKPSADPTSQHSRYYYSTKGPGIVTGIAGALGVGAGLYILHRQHDARSTVMAMPLPGGAAVRWTKPF